MHLPACFIASALFLTVGPKISTARPFNVTVDDTNGPFPLVGRNITYSNGWMQSGFNALGWHPDDTSAPATGFRQALNGTWKLSIYARNEPSGPPPRATLKFNGTAVYVSCVLADVTADGIKANSEMLFMLDGGKPSLYSQAALQVDTSQQVTVYHKDGLADTEHELVIQNGQRNGSFEHAVVFLDSVIYTTGDKTSYPSQAPASPSQVPEEPTAPATTSSATSRIGVIVASVIAVVGGLVVAGVAFWLAPRIVRRGTSWFSIKSIFACSRFHPPPPTPFLAFNNPTNIQTSTMGPSDSGVWSWLDGMSAVRAGIPSTAGSPIQLPREARSVPSVPSRRTTVLSFA